MKKTELTPSVFAFDKSTFLKEEGTLSVTS